MNLACSVPVTLELIANTTVSPVAILYAQLFAIPAVMEESASTVSSSVYVRPLGVEYTPARSPQIINLSPANVIPLTPVRFPGVSWTDGQLPRLVCVPVAIVGLPLVVNIHKSAVHEYEHF
jgi:hypothetical protein